MVRFLVDESMPRSLAPAIKGIGHDAVDVRDVGLRGHPDTDVMQHAIANNRILVTADVDFCNIIQFPPAAHHGVVVARVPNDTLAQALCNIVVAALRLIPADDYKSAVIIVEPHRLRRKHFS